MSFADAVTSVLTNYANFRGRARRSEYWWYILAYFILGIVVSIIDRAIGSSILGLIVTLALLIPSLAVLARRLHDTGRSGWWILIGIIPLIGAIVLIVFACQDSQPGVNSHGPSPKEVGQAGYPGQSGYPSYS